MSKKLSFLFLFIFCFYASAQESYTIKGKVLSNYDKLPLESATVYFTTVKDSTVLEYTLTDKNGDFVFSAKKTDKPVFLKVTFIGFQTYVDEQKDISADKDFKTIYLSESVNELESVIVKAEDVPIRIKSDTIEFKASLFKVRPDANIETLLKTLPGFEVDNDGKITVNGKEVTQVLVNGKPFFDRDGKMAIKNLPAEIINKVQVSDFKTKKEEYSKDKASSDSSSINLTIDEDKNKGYFGKFLGGYGTDERYESSFILNFFNNDRKISILGSSNNINAPGFSMDEVFDNMGGGRNSRGETFSRGSGITKSNLLGLNYSDQLFKDFQVNGNYNFSNTIFDNSNKSKSTNFLPTGNFTTDSQSTTHNENSTHKANVELEYKIGDDIRIFVAPRFNNSKSNNNRESTTSSFDENEELLNDSYSKSSNENVNNNFSNSINFNKSFEKKVRNLSIVLNNNNSKSNSNGLTDSKTRFLIDNDSIIRLQNNLSDNINDSYSAEIEYTEPITDSLRFRIGMEYNFKNSINDNKTYDDIDKNEIFTDLNDSLTNYISSKQNSIAPKAGIRFEKNKFTFDINSTIPFVQFNNHSDYLNQATNLNKKYILPYVRGQIRYRMERSKFISVRYNYNTSLPSSNQLLPVTNLADPLNTVVGNPNLKLNKRHNSSIYYRNFNFNTRSGYGLYLNGNYDASSIITSTVYDADRKRTTTYENISGNYNVSGGGHWHKSVKKDDNLLRYGMGINSNLNSYKGFTDGVLFNAKSYSLSPNIYLNYDYGEFFTIAPSYNLSYQETNYENYRINSTSNVVHRINLQTTTYWPKNWIWGNDFGYTYNSRLSSNLGKDFYLWNTSLSYTFFEDKFTAKIKVYDVLNQNQSNTRNISATAITDSENTILRRYAMFSLTYKIQDFSGMKNPPERRNYRGGRPRR